MPVRSPGDLVVNVRLTNTGIRPGRETVQIYASRPDSAIARPLRWLAGFGHAEADPGTEVTIRIRVPVRSLAHWDVTADGWRVEPGDYQLFAGRSSRDLRLTIPVTIPS